MFFIIPGILSFFLCQASKEFILLDISKDVDPDKLYLEKRSTDEIITHKYIPRNEYNILKVVDEKCVIWDGEVEKGICSLALAHLFNYSSLFLHIRVSAPNKENKDLYFEKKDGFWKSTDLHNVPSYYHFVQTSYTINKDVKFDLNSYPDQEIYDLDKCTKNGISKTSYSPKMGVNINMVVDGNEHIWERKLDDYLFQINISHIGKTPCLIELVVESGNNLEKIHYERRKSEWAPISENTYSVKLKEDDFYLPPFDIKNLDLTKFKVKQFEVFGINASIYTPSSGTNVQYILEGSMPIWESKVGDHVDKIWVYSKNGKLITTHLRIVGANNSKRINNYRRVNEGWKLVKKGEL